MPNVAFDFSNIFDIITRITNDLEMTLRRF